MEENKINSPILSIIVPVYNVEKYIRQCIESLINQDINNYEIIVVNDGTTDSSISIVNSFNNKKIRIINKQNGGLSSARNEGIKNANGKYIAFVDSDDFIAFKEAYKEMVDIAIEQDFDIVVGKALWYYSDSKVLNREKYKKIFEKNSMSSKDYLKKSIENNRIYTPVCFNIYRRELLVDNNILFKEGILHEDELFTHKILLKANKIALYPKEFYMYRQREGSIMNTEMTEKRVNDIFNICSELYNEFLEIKDYELKRLLINNTAMLIFSTVYKFKIKHIPIKNKIIMFKGCKSKKIKLRAFILLISTRLFYLLIKNKSIKV